MAGNILNKYGPNNQSITCTLANLPPSSCRQSAAVDNTTNTFVDALLCLLVTSSGNLVGSLGYVDVYAYGTVNGGTNYTGGATGSDSSFSTNNSALNSLFKLGRLPVTALNETIMGGPWSVAAGFNDTLPDHWGIVVDNETGANLFSGTLIYQGVYGQYT